MWSKKGRHRRTATCTSTLVFAGVLLAVSGAHAVIPYSIAARLQPRNAKIFGKIAFYTKAERLGYNEPGAMAWWPLSGIPAGKYHIVLSYSSGHARPSTRAGTVTVKVGSTSYPLELTGTGGWGKIITATVKDVQVESTDKTLEVRLEEREPSVKTVLDLWRVDLVRVDGMLPEAGQAIMKKTPHGQYIQYIPYTAREPIRILVSVHGTPGEQVDVLKKFSENPSDQVSDLVSVAHDQGLIVVKPAFDTPNFGGYAGPMGGYRGLFGREIRADEFVNEILEGYKQAFPGYDGRLYLHGHSAGGQFANRYVIMHPDRIIGAVISSAGTFAYPDPDKPWPAGMAPLSRTVRWKADGKLRQVVIEPDPDGWLKAAQLPIAVVVGELERQNADTPNPAQKGADHVEKAENWVKDMQALARAHGKESKVRLFILKDCGHSGSKLAPTGFMYLFGQ